VTPAAAAPRGNPAHAFYTVSTPDYFAGTVALLNSLRMTGHDGRLVVRDHGLAPRQRRLLERHCDVVTFPAGRGVNPLLLKAYPHLLGVEGVICLVDSDVIVTGPLSPIVALAASGAICAYPDYDAGRWFPDWAPLFALEAPLRRQTYIASGFVAFSLEHWPQLLPRWRSLSESISFAATRAGGAARDSPLWDGDQDALNAILMSEVPPEAVHLLPEAEAPTAEQNRRRAVVVDANRLQCTYEGVAARMVHGAGNPKPWERRSRNAAVETDVYVLLLRRMLFAPDVLVPLGSRLVPLRIRPDRSWRVLVWALDTARRAAGRGVRGVRRIMRSTA
jgi:hypothetical protein